MSRKACFRHEASTDKAYRFYPPEDKSKAFWIPRSVLEHRSQLESPKQVKDPLTQITVEDWWIEKNPELERYFS